MHLLRRIVLLLLVISLPAYGWAFIAMPACAQPSAQASASEHAMQGAHCCPEQQGKHASGKSMQGCQDDAQCQCNAWYQATQPLVAAVTPPMHSAIHFSTFPMITTTALPLWRPPTLS
jgi:hypothetical protein